MIEKTLGIVLKQIKYGETSIIAHLYTRRWGRIGIMVPGARTSSKNRKAYLFQPLTILELEVYYKANRDLQNIKEVKNHSPFMHLTGDPVKSSVALFLAEILNKALREEEPNEELFDFLNSHIQFLDLTDQGIANFHLYFLLRLSRHLGFNPGIPPAQSDLWFDLAHGTFTTSPPLHDSFLTPELTTLLIRFLSVQASDLASIVIDRNKRIELLEGILRYYYLHLEGLGEIKSHTVLHALFD
ncbi:MAG: DNA repair protein RecO [Porphyromonadaceae bacterium]|nr:MAG: DNA repair protein RecO [Porphyromonadaceae bacterium]